MLEVVLVRVPISKMMLAQLSTSHINSITHRHQHHFDGWTVWMKLKVFFFFGEFWWHSYWLTSPTDSLTGINFILIALLHWWYWMCSFWWEKKLWWHNYSFSHTYARTRAHTCIALMALSYWHCGKWFLLLTFLTHIRTDGHSHTHALTSITLTAWSYWYCWKKSSWWDFWPTSTQTQLHTHTSPQTCLQTHASASLWWSSRIRWCWKSFFLPRVPAHLHTDSFADTHPHRPISTHAFPPTHISITLLAPSYW